MATPDLTSLALQVATPGGLQLDLAVESVQLPGVAGEFGVLPGHVDLLAALRPGVIRYRANGVTKIAAIGPGFSEAGATHVRVITEFFAKPEEVTVDEARSDLAKAEARLKTLMFGEQEQIEAQTDYDWAQARIEIAQSGGAAH